MTAGADPRRVALDVLVRIDRDGAYANLALPAALGSADLEPRDRRFVTELVYGVTRMRRALDWQIEPYVLSEPDVTARAALRLGAYQLTELDTPPHAAVGETVGASPKRLRGFVNAVLRRVAAGRREYPDDATRLSYPNWIVDRLVADLGRADALAALETMNRAPAVTLRDDGYRQDRSSQLVVALVGAGPGERVADVCAAPGGKATGLARQGALVVAADRRAHRLARLVDNVAALGASVQPLVADAEAPPLRSGAFDRVLVDAPCTGLGVLRRRPDARWRIEAGAVEVLADLQCRLLDAARPLVRPGGLLVYSVCTLTEAETTGVDRVVAAAHPDLLAVPDAPEPWLAHGRGHRLLPQTIGSDGMSVFRYRVPAGPSDESR